MKGFWIWLGSEEIEKVIRYRMPDDRKRSLGAGSSSEKSWDETGLRKAA